MTVEAYAPLARAMRMTNPTLVIMAEKYGCTTAQLMVRWSIQKGFVPLPKSVRRERIVENAEIGGFAIEADDMNALDMLNEFCELFLFHPFLEDIRPKELFGIKQPRPRDQSLIGGCDSGYRLGSYRC